MRISDWSSDVCSSDLAADRQAVDIDPDRFGIAPRQRDDRRAAVDHHPDIGAVDLGIGIEMRNARPAEPHFDARGSCTRHRRTRTQDAPISALRSEERRLGKEGISKISARRQSETKKKNKTQHNKK